ncbi:MAG: DUF6390 family protein [Gaiellaceae bacterium]
MTAGALLFARYAYPPNSLGYCGADAPRTLLEYGAAGVSDGGLAEAARTFEGAWPYLELIAGANGLDDPLDPRVVEAYWIGNDLLANVGPGALVRHVDDRFRGRLGRTGERVVDVVRAGAVPHHGFHVFAVYPWLGLLRTGVVDQPLDVLERCRITPARVVALRGDVLETVARPLVWDGRVLRLGPWIPREAYWQEDGLGFIAAAAPGDWVALHWEWACDRLTGEQARSLTRATRRTLDAVNAAGSARSALT